ncbi:MAG: hypothetical protein PHU75_04520 [Candidatus Nanopelagicales bacterium]|nr:hypothetical protein [Candidatus Nanopelagicales bacterium]
MRAVAKYALAVIAVLVLVPGMGLWGTALLVGSEQAVVGTVDAVLSSPEARQAMGDAFVDELLKKADPQQVAKVTASRAELGEAAAEGIADQASAISATVRQGYVAVMDGTPTTVDLAPVLISIMHRLHAVDAAVPDDKEFLEAKVSIDAQGVDGTTIVRTILGTSWFVIGIGLGLLVAVAFLSVSKGWRRWRLPGICLVIAGAWWSAFALSLPSAASSATSDANASSIADSVGGVLAHQYLLIGLGAVVVGAVLIVLSIVLRGATAMPASVDAGTPAPA